MPATSLFIGRFQPFHYGHLDALEQISKDYTKQDFKILIGIGSSESELTFKNPLSYFERKKMIEATLKNTKFENKIEILPIPDFGNSVAWRDYILTNFPKFEAVYSGNPYTLTCFQNLSQINSHQVNLRKYIKALNIRRLILQNSNWKKLVPTAVFEFLQKLNVTERLKEIERFEDELNHGRFWQDLSFGVNFDRQKKLILIVEKLTDLEYVQMDQDEKCDLTEGLYEMKKYYQTHQNSKQKLIKLLKKHNLSFDIIKGEMVEKVDFDCYKIVLSLGGDGTFLRTAKKVKQQLMAGVNSQPGKSVGKLTAFQSSNLENLIVKLLEFKTNTKNFENFESWNRLRACLNGKKLDFLAVNEVFFGVEKIYKTSRFILKEKDRKTLFYSNGALVTTFQGSTAFYFSAGGKNLQNSSQLGFISLMTYLKRGQKDCNFVFNPDQKIILIPQRLGHKLVFDSDEQMQISLDQGDRVEIFCAKGDVLRVLVEN